MGERLARLDLATEGEKCRPHGIPEPAVGNDHVENRLGLFGYVLPDAERLKQPPRGGDNRRSAFIAGVAVAERGIGDGDGKAWPQRLPKRNRQCEAGKAAAGNQHVDLVVPSGHITQRFTSVCS